MDKENQTVRFLEDGKNLTSAFDDSRLLSLAPQELFHTNADSDCYSSAGGHTPYTFEGHAPNVFDQDRTLVNSTQTNYLDKTQAIHNLIEQNKILSEKMNAFQGWRQEFAVSSASNFGAMDCYGCSDREAQLQHLSSTLGKTEFEMSQLQQYVTQMKNDHDLRKHQDHEVIEQLKSHLVSFESQVQELSEKNKRLSKENDKFLAYKATLPTKNEFLKLKSELEIERDKKDRLKEKLVSTSKQLENSRAVEKANQMIIIDRNKDIEQLKADLVKSNENVRILENCLKSDYISDGESELPHVTITNLKREVSELTSELAKMKKLAKTQRSALKNEASKHEKEVSECSSKMQSLEEKNEALMVELKELKLEYKLLKTTCEELSQDNVFLKQENDAICEENHELKNLQLSEKYKTNKIVMKQLEQCHKQMREIFSILHKFKTDKDVDLSFIIGTESQTSSEDIELSSLPIGERVSRLQSDLKRFRDEINDHAATMVGSDCNIQ